MWLSGGIRICGFLTTIGRPAKEASLPVLGERSRGGHYCKKASYGISSGHLQRYCTKVRGEGGRQGKRVGETKWASWYIQSLTSLPLSSYRIRELSVEEKAAKVGHGPLKYHCLYISIYTCLDSEVAWV